MSRPAVLVLLLALAVACAQTAADAGGAISVPNEAEACASDAECPVDQQCLAARRVCSASGALPYRVSLNVVPPETDADGAPTSYVQTQWIDLGLGPDHERNLTLSTPQVLEGPIDLMGLNDPCYAPTSIVATTTADIAGWVEYRFTGVITPDAENGAWRYRLAVIPDRAYRLTVFIGVVPGAGCSTTELVYPPVVLERFVSNQVDRAEIEFVAPPLDDALVGTLRFDDGAAVAGVRLVASSPDGSITFGASVTDEQGRFELRLPVGMAEFLLVAHPTSQHPQFPLQTVGGEFLAGDAAKGGLELIVPALPAPAAARLLVHDEAGLPEPDVELTLTGAVAGGTVRLSATTDGSGLATFELFSGAYVLVAEPPEGAHAGALMASVEVPEGGSDLTVDLPEKVVARIDVQDEATGEGIVGADLYLSLVALPGAASGVERRYHLVSDTLGSAEARLEPGTWRLLAVPDAASGLPRWSRGDVVVGADTHELPITVPSPWILHGRVVAPNGLPVANAAIEALGDAATAKETDDTTSAGQGYNDRGLTAVLGQTVTDAEGRFLLALPFSN